MSPHAEAALAAFEHATSLLAVSEGPEHVLRALNASARAVYGDRTGLPLATVFPDGVAHEVVALADEVYRTGQQQVRDEVRLPLPADDAPESVREVYLRLALSPTLDADGVVRGLIAEATDITESVYRRRAADARSADVQRRYDAAAQTLVTLQDALLPEGLPLVHGLELAARYLLTEDGASAGGDWFDAIALADGRTVLVVGDVVGHGVRASVVMGELRTLFDERVRADGDVLAALELLEGRARRIPVARAATVCVAVLDPASRTMQYCTAGHPPPLVVTAGGDARYLPLSGAAPLGSGREFTMAEVSLGVGDVVVIYSDGLVERPGRSSGQNTVDLARTVGDLVRDHTGAEPGDDPLVEQVGRRTGERRSRDSGVDDDVSLVAAQVVDSAPDLEVCVPAFPDALRVVRHELGGWLAAYRVDQLDELALQHAVGELVSNVVEHAYGDDVQRMEATVTVRGRLAPGGSLELEVCDRGSWRPPPQAGGRGRGLAMAEGFADELEVSHDEVGTVVRLRHWAKIPVSLLTSSRRARPRVGDDPLQVTGDEPLMRVSGPLDAQTADEFRHRLAHASRGGTKEVHLDLGGVGVLASAGVQVLYDAGAGDPDSRIVLVAPMGSPAQHVLGLVQLPYTTSLPEDPASR